MTQIQHGRVLMLFKINKKVIKSKKIFVAVKIFLEMSHFFNNIIFILIGPRIDNAKRLSK